MTSSKQALADNWGEAVPPPIANTYLQQFETECDLLQYQVDGWCIWPVLRFRAAMALQNIPLDMRKDFPLGDRLTIAAKDILGLTRIRKARYVVKSNSLPRSEQENGLYKDIYFDDLLREIGSYFRIEDVVYKVMVPNNAALIKSDITSMAFKIMGHLLAHANVPPYIAAIARDLSAAIRREPRLAAYTPHKLGEILRYFYWSKRLYAWLLSRIQPEYLLLITAYGDHALVAAARELGIKVIEFQHGFIDRHHPGYSWSSYAKPYKANMPIPHRIFLYGEYWKQELMANGFWDQELCVVGSLRVDQYRNRMRDKKDGSTPIIVLTTQATDTLQLIAFVTDFLKIAKGRLAFQLYLKLHPGEQNKEPYETAFGTDSRVHIVLGRELPSTFELLTRARVHISIASTCHYEALALGVPTVILPLAGYENVLHLHVQGHAFLARTPQELLDILERVENYQLPKDTGAIYFTRDALENMKRELGVIV